MPHALIVEDDHDSAEALAELIKAEGFSTAAARTLAEARQQILLRSPDVILLDLLLPDGSGMDLFEEVGEIADSEIVLVTGHASLDTSIQALRLGAADYLTKPIDVRQLKSVLARRMPPGELRTRIASLEKDVSEVGRYGRLWGRSKAMQEVYRRIGRVAGTAVNVLVTGESGTGKEYVARTIHDLSRRLARS
jgi:two-component system, NtrC family, response regulator AtoC